MTDSCDCLLTSMAAKKLSEDLKDYSEIIGKDVNSNAFVLDLIEVGVFVEAGKDIHEKALELAKPKRTHPWTLSPLDDQTSRTSLGPRLIRFNDLVEEARNKKGPAEIQDVRETLVAMAEQFEQLSHALPMCCASGWNLL